MQPGLTRKKLSLPYYRQDYYDIWAYLNIVDQSFVQIENEAVLAVLWLGRVQEWRRNLRQVLEIIWESRTLYTGNSAGFQDGKWIFAS